MPDILEQLNSSQRKAVTTKDGAVLVIAGAGSGKTRVIEYRVLYLIQQGADPRSILLLTFTRRAARQMLARAGSLDPRCEHVDGGTFHSFAYRVLRKYASVFGFADSFTVLDESDAEEAVSRCAQDVGLYDHQVRAPKKGTLKSIISMSTNKGKPIKEIIARSYPQFTCFSDDIERLRARYTEYKVSKSYLDYDDLLIYLKLLLEDPAMHAKITERYRYIMVDEYQDTNKLQGEITALLGASGNVMVVGDDAQSIYGFRGATHGNIMQFPKLFADCKIIKLEDNYRSCQSVLNVANAVLANMQNRYDKSLRAARKDDFGRPQLLFFRDAEEEASWIAQDIIRKRDEGMDLARQAVLFRSAYVSVQLQAELARRNVPFAVFGGMKFYETAHVKDVLAFLKTALNPRDELSWSRLFALLDGVGPKTAALLTAEAVACDNLPAIAGYFSARSENESRLSQPLRLLSALYKELGNAERTPAELFERVIAFYHPILKTKFDDWRDRENDLAAILQIVGRYQSLEDLLSDMALDPPDRGVSAVLPEVRDEAPVSLSTIHSAKGLEWDAVYFLGLADGILPSAFSLDTQEDMEEELRLFYVGITRAKTHLFLSVHHENLRGGMSMFNKVSRFLDDPLIRSHLDVPRGGGDDAVIYVDEQGEEMPGFTKKGLLDRLMDMQK